MSEKLPKETAENRAASVAITEAALAALAGPGKGCKQVSLKFTGAAKGEVRLQTEEKVEEDVTAAILAAASELVASGREDVAAAGSVSIIKLKKKGTKVDITFAAGAAAGKAQKGGAKAAKPAGKKGQKKQKGGAAKGAVRTCRQSAVDEAYERLLAAVVATAAKLGPEKAASKEALEAELGEEFRDTLHAMQNRAYAGALASVENLPGLFIPRGADRK